MFGRGFPIGVGNDSGRIERRGERVDKSARVGDDSMQWSGMISIRWIGNNSAMESAEMINKKITYKKRAGFRINVYNI